MQIQNELSQKMMKSKSTGEEVKTVMITIDADRLVLSQIHQDRL